MRVNTPVVISCNEHRREVSALQTIANKQIDRTFMFDKVVDLFLLIFLCNVVRIRSTLDSKFGGNVVYSLYPISFGFEI